MAFLEVGAVGSSSAEPCVGTCFGETFLLDDVLLGRGFEVGGVCWKLWSAGAFPFFWAGELSGEETISSNSVGCCSEVSVDFEIRGVLGKVFLDDLVERDREEGGVDVSLGSGEAEENPERRVLGL